MQISLYFRDRDDKACSIDFAGRELGQVSIERNFQERGGLWRRTYTWTVYQTDDGRIIFYRYWREILSRNWSGAVACYDTIHHLLREIHLQVGREGCLAKLRKHLLLNSLMGNLPAAT